MVLAWCYWSFWMDPDPLEICTCPDLSIPWKICHPCRLILCNMATGVPLALNTALEKGQDQSRYALSIIRGQVSALPDLF